MMATDSYLQRKTAVSDVIKVGDSCGIKTLVGEEAYIFINIETFTSQLQPVFKIMKEYDAF